METSQFRVLTVKSRIQVFVRDPEEIEKCIYRTLNHSESFETPSYESMCVLRNNLYIKQNNKNKNGNKSTIYT